MLSISLIRQKPDWIKERLIHRGFRQTELVDELLKWDEKKRSYQQINDELQAGVNAASKEIGKLMSQGKKELAEEKKKEVAALKSRMDTQKMEEAEENIQAILQMLPNIPHASVPAGVSAEQNEELRCGGQPREGEALLPHWDLASKFNLIDFETGNKITGSGFPVYRGQGARLQRALIQYFLDFNTTAGYTEYQPPLLVNEASAFGTGQLPDKEGQMYHVTEDSFYLIPTSEVPLTNIFRDEILKESDLPVKMTAYTPCFRREAGSYGKDVRGLNRLHQFDKVEIVQLVHPDKSYQALEEMLHHVELLVQSLGFHYRILRLCGGDLGFTSALTYDFEVWSPAQKRWLEVSSVSNFESFQTNRLKARFRPDDGKPQLLHSLNGSSLALPRILACLLEQYQEGDKIVLPAVLHNYFGAGDVYL